MYLKRWMQSCDNLLSISATCYCSIAFLTVTPARGPISAVRVSTHLRDHRDEDTVAPSFVSFLCRTDGIVAWLWPDKCKFPPREWSCMVLRASHYAWFSEILMRLSDLYKNVYLIHLIYVFLLHVFHVFHFYLYVSMYVWALSLKCL